MRGEGVHIKREDDMSGSNGYYGSGGYGRPGGYSPYEPWGYDPILEEKLRQKRRLSKISVAVGFSVLSFSALGFLLAVLLKLVPGFSENYPSNEPFFISFNILYYLVIVGLPFLAACLYLKEEGELKELPLGAPVSGAVFWLLVSAGLMACIAGSYASSMLGSMVENIFGVRFNMPQDDIRLNTGANIFLTIVQTALLPALIEEFSVRGVVLQPLRRYGDWFAVLMSSVVFAMMHGNMVQIPFAFIAGIAIGYAVLVTGSLWTGVLIHFLNNLAVTLMQIAYDNCAERTADLVTVALVSMILVSGALCSAFFCKRYARGFRLTRGRYNLLSGGEKASAFLFSVPMLLALGYLVYQTFTFIEF